ncbi:TIM barrel protein [Frigidibacter sp. RF13]|uniref:TIM barrel protein n=1 Tax=Frigidibacter sp. RF13 TaxID=2997340 RepID=UPI002271AF6A|nr:TIM barrel protein [Frigidibacter sp. RF13]MCY1127920.1 TIM barrel protein [Frigidibacter sp. RF13]
MVRFAINHMTMARMGFDGLLTLARELGLVGIELRNDLSGPLFGGLAPEEAGARIKAAGLRLLALAEVKRFNDWSSDKGREALSLIRIAKAAGAEAVSLIPRNDNQGMGNGERQANLRLALRELKPMLEDHDLIGMVEPLGFPICALRHKAEAVEAVEALGAKGRFRLVHDTFHHFLAGGGPIYPDHTGIIHISGVTAPAIAAEEMQDAHRVLVDGHDRLGNVEQIAAFEAVGWQGPVSFEAFASEVHALPDPGAALKASMKFIGQALEQRAA